MTNEVGVIRSIVRGCHGTNVCVVEEVHKPSDDSVLIVKFNPEESAPRYVSEMVKMLSEEVYSSNTVIALPKGLSLESIKIEDLVPLYNLIGNILDSERNDEEEISDDELTNFLNTYNQVVDAV